MNSCLDNYFKDIERFSVLTLDEERALFNRVTKGDSSARNCLIRANLKFVVSTARNYMYQGVPLADLVQAGNIGLITAIKKFDVNKNFRFVSYAVWWIRNSILRTIAEQSRPLKINCFQNCNLMQLGRAHEKLQQRYHREPTLEEISIESGITDKNMLNLVRIMRTTPIEDMAEFLGAEDEDINRTVLGIDSSYIIKKLNTLRPREKIALLLYYGFEERKYSLEDIGKQMGISRERVRQILVSAKKNLSKHLNIG